MPRSSTHPRIDALSPTSSPSIPAGSASSSLPSNSISSLDTSPLTRTRSGGNHRPAPYMVALSGWPEPVYIESPMSDWHRKGGRSGPTTPLQNLGSGEVRDGIEIPPRGGSPVGWRGNGGGSLGSNTARMGGDGMGMLGGMSGGLPGNMGFAEGGGGSSSSPIASGTKAMPSTAGVGIGRTTPARPSDTSYRVSPRGTPPNEPSLQFQTSSTRSSVHTSGNTSSLRDKPGISLPPSGGPRSGNFLDPRLAPNVAVMQNRGALRVAPSWGNSSNQAKSAIGGTSGSSPGTSNQPVIPAGIGVKIPAGQRGTGLLVMRAVPDVYPPPSHSSPKDTSMPPPSSTYAHRRNSNGSGVGGIGGIAGMMTSISGGSMSKGSPGGSGVATEVYPRDPESGFLWGEGASPSTAGTGVGVKSPDGMNIDG